MTWSRLFHINSMVKAIARVTPGQPLEQLPISKRYQASLRKEFRMAGVPWIYNMTPPTTRNPREKRPKMKKRQISKAERLLKIQKALAENEEKVLEFRQHRLDNRRMGGVDRYIQKGIPSWVKGDTSDVPEYLLKRKKNKSSEQ